MATEELNFKTLFKLYVTLIKSQFKNMYNRKCLESI